MTQHLGALALIVHDYDEAIHFYVETLGFILAEDTDLGGGKRWVRVTPPGGMETSLLLAKAVTHEQSARVGDQTGGRVFLFLHTEDFAGDVERLTAKGVTFVRPPRQEPYGWVAVFADLYGNLWDLLGPRP